MLISKNLHVSIKGHEILKGLDLIVNAGETHAIMGPNGSGKSTFANTLAGHPSFSVSKGEVLYQGENLLGMTPDVRARKGLFLAFQYPVELPGVRTWQFLRSALDNSRTSQGLEPLGVREFDKWFEKNRELVEMEPTLTNRSVNEGFSGGEKKRGEILQMLVMEPKLMLLDEPDSGLDVDALKVVADGVNYLRDKERSIILVTHYQRLLTYIVPDFVHILLDGKIVSSGGPELAEKVESKGYDWLREAPE
jgi:Fe-S cluster assembly ATP-binding protein